MVSPLKTDNRESNLSKGSIKPLKALTLISASVALSTLVGCGSVQLGPGDTEEPAVQSVVEQKNEQANESAETQSAQIKEEKQQASEQDADKMMASLKAPLVEPGAQEEKEEVKQEIKEEVKEVVEAAKEEVVATAVVEQADESKPEMQTESTSAPIEQAATVATATEQVVAKAKEVVKPVVEAVKSVAKKAMKGPAKPLAISKKDLPATYDIWVLKNGETVHTEGLVISTPTWEMGKEGYMSQIWLTIKDDALHVNSSSDIATKVKGLGVSIDGGDLIPFTKVLENKIAVVEGDWLDTLANAKKLDIYLGFFPGKKPLSDRFKSDTSLDNLDRVVATYRKLK